MDLGIKGRRALLLASTRGLGFASALALAREGVFVCVSGSNGERAEEAAAKIRKESGGAAMGLPGDLSKPANMETLVADAAEGLGGGIDILLLNHGGPQLRSALEVTQDELVALSSIMMKSMIRAAQLVVPGMGDREWGRVVLVGAPSVGEPIPHNVLSNLYRGGMANYCKTLAAEVIGKGVTVNIVSPSAVLTERTQSTAEQRGALRGVSAEEELATRESALPAGRFGKPEEYGATVAFICSDLAGYTTGTNIRVDGGAAKGFS
jgi:3-oxoacyl-[acyl-carrier protein] reductase